MIQRVQSVYLLLVTVLMSVMLVRPYAELTLADDKSLTFRTHAIIMDSESEATTLFKTTIPVVGLALIIAILSFGNIFLYNRRIVQLRICLTNIILLLALLVIMFAYYSTTKASLTTIHHTFKISVIFPLLSLIFTIMAYRTIHHDEVLVNSYKRIR